MGVLVRKYSAAKWAEADPKAVSHISADAITVDLRTRGRTLSFWMCDSSTREDLTRAALALAPGLSELTRIDLVWLSPRAVEDAGLVVEENPDEDNPIEALRAAHRDIVKLDYAGLGRCARLMSEALRAGQHHRFTPAEVGRLLREAIQHDLLALEHLSSRKLRAKVAKALGE